MITTSTALNAAAAAAYRTVKNKITLDSGKTGDPTAGPDIAGLFEHWHISRTPTTDLPAAARLAQGYVAAELTATVKGKVTPDVGILDGAKMWSPYSSAGIASGGVGSLITAGIRVSAGMDTTDQGGSGVELQPRFTGFLNDQDVHLGARNADLVAYDRWASLNTPVVLPVMGNSYLTSAVSPRVGIRPNLYATTVMDFGLRQNGRYATPPPRSTCILSVPAHGSLHAEPGYGALDTRSPCIEEAAGSAAVDGTMVAFAPSGAFCGGPFGDNGKSGALPSLVPVTTGTTASPTDIKALYDPQDGANFGNTFDTNQQVCIEAWIKVGTPFPMGHVATDSAWGIRFWQAPGGGVSDSAHILTLYVLADGTPGVAVGSSYVRAQGTSPAVNGWAYYRFHVLNNGGTNNTRIYINNQALQLLTVSAAPLATSGSTTAFQMQLCRNRGTATIASAAGVFLSFEALQVTQEGFGSAPSNYAFHPTAYLDKSLAPLVVVPHSDTARDCRQLLIDLTGAEYGMSIFDELGEFYFFNRQRWSRAPGNTSQLSVTSTNALSDTDINQSADGVFNQITVDFQPYGIQLHGQVYQLSKTVGVHSGATFDYWIHMPYPVLGLDVGAPTAPNGQAGTLPPLVAGPYANSGYRCSWWPDGRHPSGSGLSDPPTNVEVDVTVIDDQTVKCTITNNESNPIYMVSGSDQAAGTRGQPAIVLFGRAVIINDTSAGDNSGQATSYTVDDSASQDEYGVRPLELNAGDEWCQSLTVAASVGDDQLAYLKDLHPTVTNFVIKAHPGLQIGDRISASDPSATLLNESAIVVGDEEDYDMQPNGAGQGYTQALSLRLGL